MSALDTLFDELDQTELQAKAPKEQPSSATKQPEEKYTKSTLFVRGIPKNATNEELTEFFSDIGPIRSCFIVTEKSEATAPADAGADGADAAEADTADKDTKDVKPVKSTAAPGKAKGFGFVQYVLAEDAARAIKELSEIKFRDEKRLMLDFAMKKNSAAQDGEDKKKKAGKRTRPESAASDDPQKSEADQKPKKPKVTKSPSGPTRTILISGIPAGVTKHQLIKKLKKSGTPSSVVYPVPAADTEQQPEDGADGSAHVTFDSHTTAAKAVKSLHDHVFKGAKLTAALKTEVLDRNARLIVRNLSFKVRERELERLFSECGTVLSVDLPRKYTGGPLRGFAFVQMGDYECAERAVTKFSGYTLQGRQITVAVALSKDKFKEMEEKGKVEKQEFEPSAQVDEDIEMGSDADAAESDSDVEMGSGNESDGPEDNDSDKDESQEDSDDEVDEIGKLDKEDNVVDESLQGGCTLFIRNLSFDSEEDDLYELFREFGKLRYVRIVYDNQTGRSRGTAFVCFWSPADATKCLEAAGKAQESSGKLGSVPTDKTLDQRTKSVLLQETSGVHDSSSQFVLDGRMLSVAKAVDRSTAHNLATEGIESRKAKDKRCAYLLKEGVVFPNTPAAGLMAPADLEHHIKEYGVRKNQILKNPNLYMSKTRLTIHNIPRSIEEPALRSAAMSAISKFKQEVKDGKRRPLSAEEMAEGWDKLPRLVQCKIVRSNDRVDAKTGKSRSLGYAFIEFSTHAHALACLRFLNFRNSKQAFSKVLLDDDDEEEGGSRQKSAHEISRRSLRVMFAIENAQIVHKRELRTKVAEKNRSMKATGAGADDKGRDKAGAKGKGKNRNFGMAPTSNISASKLPNRSKFTQGNRSKRQ
ncbi:RNA recognition motif-containing protein [Coemansia interrupta]|uniref:RNA recognition motif-containing protein n=1 Tax=Coemansia interrupta TaxID=1126814 RepID=A0A9W8HDC3_9FUNG|nr:RNA recognition motif-containing protein [Coemansia interrupta]